MNSQKVLEMENIESIKLPRSPALGPRRGRGVERGGGALAVPGDTGWKRALEHIYILIIYFYYKTKPK